MKRLNKQAGVQPIKEFIDKYYQKGGQSNFNEFRKAFNEQYVNEIKKYPLMEIEMDDMDAQNGNGLELLEDIYHSNLVYELDNEKDKEQIYDNLMEVYLHDFWIEIPGLYKTEL
jgi:hypothetical protein